MQTASDEYDMPVLLFGGGAIALALVIALVCNFLYRSTFASTAVGLAVPLLAVAMLLVCLISPTWEIQSPGQDFGDGQLLSAAALVFLAVLVLTAVAVASSTRFGEVATLLFCAGALELGLITDYVIGPHVDTSTIAKAAYYIVPNLGFFWVTDALTQEHPISASYVLLVAAYAACFIVAALGVAVALFQRREVG